MKSMEFMTLENSKRTEWISLEVIATLNTVLGLY